MPPRDGCIVRVGMTVGSRRVGPAARRRFRPKRDAGEVPKRETADHFLFEALDNPMCEIVIPFSSSKPDQPIEGWRKQTGPWEAPRADCAGLPGHAFPSVGSGVNCVTDGPERSWELPRAGLIPDAAARWSSRKAGNPGAVLPGVVGLLGVFPNWNESSGSGRSPLSRARMGSGGK